MSVIKIGYLIYCMNIILFCTPIIKFNIQIRHLTSIDCEESSSYTHLISLALLSSKTDDGNDDDDPISMGNTKPFITLAYLASIFIMRCEPLFGWILCFFLNIHLLFEAILTSSNIMFISYPPNLYHRFFALFMFHFVFDFKWIGKNSCFAREQWFSRIFLHLNAKM